MKKTLHILLTVFWLTVVWTPALAGGQVEIRYSKNLKVEYRGNLTLITVSNPWPGATTGFHYLLKPRGTATPEGYTDYQVVEIPIGRMVALSSTYLAFIDQLDLTRELVGFSDLSRVHSVKVREASLKGRIKEVGQGSNLLVETILDLEPDIIFTYATGGFRDAHPKLLEAGLKVGVCAEYMESHPLGRAEWIKFIALFYDKGQEAERLFNIVEARYLQLARLTKNVSKRPTVITNVPFSGRWTVSGGNSFIARFLKDSGADYVWKETTQDGGIPMDIELVYDRGLNAEFWLNTSVWTSLAQARRSVPRMAGFASLQAGNLFNNNKRMNEAGSNDFWESGMMKPDVILADLIRIFHPELLPDHELYYYRQLK
jgi:iron complex transport system substrate-binding protein